MNSPNWQQRINIHRIYMLIIDDFYELICVKLNRENNSWLKLESLYFCSAKVFKHLSKNLVCFKDVNKISLFS